MALLVLARPSKFPFSVAGFGAAGRERKTKVAAAAGLAFLAAESEAPGKEVLKLLPFSVPPSPNSLSKVQLVKVSFFYLGWDKPSFKKEGTLSWPLSLISRFDRASDLRSFCIIQQ